MTKIDKIVTQYDLIKINSKMSLRSFIKGIDYYRAIEYEILIEFLKEFNIFKGKRILDIGCGEEVLPSYLSKKMSKNVFAIDNSFDKIKLQKRYREYQLKKNNSFHLIQMDALKNGIKDKSFDLVINLAMISLLKDGQDIELITEIYRILKPEGLLCISLGYSLEFSEKIDYSAKIKFRRYDEKTLKIRIIDNSGFTEIKRIYFGEERLKFNKYWYRLPFLFRLPFRCISPVFSKIFCKQLDYEKRRYADGIFLVLRKQ